MKSELYPMHDKPCHHSLPYRDPIESVHWGKLNLDQPWLPEMAVSLFGNDEFQALSRAQRYRLSQLEYSYFLEVGLWLESLFISQLCQITRQQKAEDFKAQKNRLHEIREEAGHSLMFCELLQTAGLPRITTEFHQYRGINLVAKFGRRDSLLMSVATLICEELPDRMNRTVLRHKAELNPAIVEISRIHAVDEARHIIRAKHLVIQSGKTANIVNQWVVRHIIGLFLQQIIQILYFPPANLYSLAGLYPGDYWAELARHNASRHQFVHHQIATSLHDLRQLGFSLNWQEFKRRHILF